MPLVTPESKKSVSFNENNNSSYVEEKTYVDRLYEHGRDKLRRRYADVKTYNFPFKPWITKKAQNLNLGNYWIRLYPEPPKFF